MAYNETPTLKGSVMHPIVITAYWIGLVIIVGLIAFAVKDFVKFIAADKKRNRNKKNN